MNEAIDNTSSGPRSRLRLVTLAAMSLVMALVVVSPARAAGGNSLNAKACQKGGWTNLVTTTGATFAGEEACVAYGAKGGMLKREQTISFTSGNPSPVTVGGTYTPTASATSGLPVAITVDSASGSVCSQSGAVVSFNAAGTCTINANQAGDPTYNPAPQLHQSITVTNPVNPSQATCESYGGTFGTATSLWTCKALPDTASNAFPSALQNRCLADGGIGIGAVHNSAGPWDVWCFASAVDVLIWITGLTVAAAITP